MHFMSRLVIYCSIKTCLQNNFRRIQLSYTYNFRRIYNLYIKLGICFSIEESTCTIFSIKVIVPDAIFTRIEKYLTQNTDRVMKLRTPESRLHLIGLSPIFASDAILICTGIRCYGEMIESERLVKSIAMMQLRCTRKIITVH